MTSQPLVCIVGRMNCDPPRPTAQSNMGIRMGTSFDKFLALHVQKTRRELLQLWMKTLFISSSADPIKKIRALYAAELSKLLVDPMWRDKLPLDGAYELHVIFTFEWLKGASAKVKIDNEWMYKTTSPDTDNMYKVFKDAFEKTGIIKNDSMIVRDIVEKRHGDDVGISWRLKELPLYKEKPGLFPN